MNEIIHKTLKTMVLMVIISSVIMILIVTIRPGLISAAGDNFQVLKDGSVISIWSSNLIMPEKEIYYYQENYTIEEQTELEVATRLTSPVNIVMSIGISGSGGETTNHYTMSHDWTTRSIDISGHEGEITVIYSVTITNEDGSSGEALFEPLNFEDLSSDVLLIMDAMYSYSNEAGGVIGMLPEHENIEISNYRYVIMDVTYYDLRLPDSELYCDFTPEHISHELRLFTSSTWTSLNSYIKYDGELCPNRLPNNGFRRTVIDTTDMPIAGSFKRVSWVNTSTLKISGSAQVAVWASHVLPDEEPETEKLSYTIDLEHFSETLVQDDTWLHDILYDDIGWPESWRMATTLRIRDENGQTVPGWFRPELPSTSGLESLEWAWPPRQFNLFRSINYDLAGVPIEPATDRRFMYNQPDFKNLTWVQKGLVLGYANDVQWFSFEPFDLDTYEPITFYMDLTQIRQLSDLSDEYSTWGAPYHHEQYNWSYNRPVHGGDQHFYLWPYPDHPDYIDDHIDWEDEEDFRDHLDILYPDYPDQWRDEVPSLGPEDRWQDASRIYTRVQIRVQGLTAMIRNKAPIGYLFIFFDAVRELPEGMDDDDLLFTMPFMDEEIIINMTNENFQGLFGTIRMFSGWVLYAFLGTFFYREYRKITGSGGEG